MITKEALLTANKIGYAVFLCPSYVLGGKNMVITFGNDDIIYGNYFIAGDEKLNFHR